MFKKISRYIQQNRVAFWFALIYVCLGGMQAYTVYPNDIFYNDYFFVEWLFTLPACIFSFSYRFTEKDSSWIVVVIIQALLFPLIFMATVKLFNRFKSKAK